MFCVIVVQVAETSSPKLYVVVSIDSKGEIHSMSYEIILGNGVAIKNTKVSPMINIAQKKEM